MKDSHKLDEKETDKKRVKEIRLEATEPAIAFYRKKGYTFGRGEGPCREGSTAEMS